MSDESLASSCQWRPRSARRLSVLALQRQALVEQSATSMPPRQHTMSFVQLEGVGRPGDVLLGLPAVPLCLVAEMGAQRLALRLY